MHKFKDSNEAYDSAQLLIDKGWQETEHKTYEDWFFVEATPFTISVLGDPIELELDIRGIGGRPNDRQPR